jgi:GNAT superfamily N-acetyltransferase
MAQSRDKPAGWKYGGLEEFVLAEGRSWEPQPLPENVAKWRGKPKECYKNAADAVIGMDGKDPLPDSRYVEGYVHVAGIEGLPIAHAWAVDKDGKVLELTLDEPGVEYVGVEVPTDVLTATLLRREMYGVFEDYQGGFPFLQHGMAPPPPESPGTAPTLTDALNQSASLVSQAKDKPEGWKYGSREELILTEGRSWEPQPLPKSAAAWKGEPKRCYKNSADAVFGMNGKKPLPDARYVEGFVQLEGVPPIAHAWVVDKDDKVLELTLDEPGAEYRGVEIPNDVLAGTLLRRDGVLDDWQAGFPFLQNGMAPAPPQSPGTAVSPLANVSVTHGKGAPPVALTWLRHDDSELMFLKAEAEEWQQTGTLEEYGNSETLLAVENGKYIGVLQYEVSFGPGVIYVENLEVAPDQRRRGIATTLMARLHERYPDMPVDHGERTEDGTAWADATLGGAKVTMDGEPLPPQSPGTMTPVATDLQVENVDGALTHLQRIGFSRQARNPDGSRSNTVLAATKEKRDKQEARIGASLDEGSALEEDGGTQTMFLVQDGKRVAYIQYFVASPDAPTPAVADVGIPFQFLGSRDARLAVWKRAHPDKTVVLIDRLEVRGDLQRQGLATSLMARLHEKYPDTPVDHGNRTADGEAWAASALQDARVTMNGDWFPEPYAPPASPGTKTTPAVVDVTHGEGSPPMQFIAFGGEIVREGGVLAAGFPGDPSQTLLAAEDDKYVGYLQYEQLGDGSIRVVNLETAPDQRRRGIATNLMTKLHERYPDAAINHGDRTVLGTQWANATLGGADVTMNGKPLFFPKAPLPSTAKVGRFVTATPELVDAMPAGTVWSDWRGEEGQVVGRSNGSEMLWQKGGTFTSDDGWEGWKRKDGNYEDLLAYQVTVIDAEEMADGLKKKIVSLPPAPPASPGTQSDVVKTVKLDDKELRVAYGEISGLQTTTRVFAAFIETRGPAALLTVDADTNTVELAFAYKEDRRLGLASSLLKVARLETGSGLAADSGARSPMGKKWADAQGLKAKGDIPFTQGEADKAGSRIMSEITSGYLAQDLDVRDVTPSEPASPGTGMSPVTPPPALTTAEKQAIIDLPSDDKIEWLEDHALEGLEIYTVGGCEVLALALKIVRPDFKIAMLNGGWHVVAYDPETRIAYDASGARNLDDVFVPYAGDIKELTEPVREGLRSEELIEVGIRYDVDPADVANGDYGLSINGGESIWDDRDADREPWNPELPFEGETGRAIWEAGEEAHEIGLAGLKWNEYWHVPFDPTVTSDDPNFVPPPPASPGTDPKFIDALQVTIENGFLSSENGYVDHLETPAGDIYVGDEVTYSLKGWVGDKKYPEDEPEPRQATAVVRGLEKVESVDDLVGFGTFRDEWDKEIDTDLIVAVSPNKNERAEAEKDKEAGVSRGASKKEFRDFPQTLVARHPDFGVVGAMSYVRDTYTDDSDKRREGEIRVLYLHVPEEHRRKWVASTLNEVLAKEFPTVPVDHGSRTTEGDKWAAGASVSWLTVGGNSVEAPASGVTDGAVWNLDQYQNLTWNWEPTPAERLVARTPDPPASPGTETPVAPPQSVTNPLTDSDGVIVRRLYAGIGERRLRVLEANGITVSLPAEETDVSSLGLRDELFDEPVKTISTPKQDQRLYDEFVGAVADSLERYPQVADALGAVTFSSRNDIITKEEKALSQPEGVEYLSNKHLRHFLTGQGGGIVYGAFMPASHIGTILRNNDPLRDDYNPEAITKVKGKIFLNDLAIFSDTGGDYYERGKEAKSIAPGFHWAAVATHEFGHALANTLTTSFVREDLDFEANRGKTLASQLNWEYRDVLGTYAEAARVLGTTQKARIKDLPDESEVIVPRKAKDGGDVAGIVKQGRVYEVVEMGEDLGFTGTKQVTLVSHPHLKTVDGALVVTNVFGDVVAKAGGWGLFRNHDITPQEIAAVSKYATTKPEEAFCELFTAYELGVMDESVRPKFESLLEEFGVTPPPPRTNLPDSPASPGTTDPMEQELEQIVQGISDNGTQIDAWVSWGEFLTIKALRTSKEDRGTGKGTEAMKQLLDFADRNGLIAALTPLPVKGQGLSKTKLVAWYKRLGFRMNSGQNTDFRTSERMIRKPVPEPPASPGTAPEFLSALNFTVENGMLNPWNLGVSSGYSASMETAAGEMSPGDTVYWEVGDPKITKDHKRSGVVVSVDPSSKQDRGGLFTTEDSNGREWMGYGEAVTKIVPGNEDVSTKTIVARHPDYVEPVGSLSYIERADYVEVEMLYVPEEHRRKWVASTLNAELNKLFPDTPIDHGYRTDDGEAWSVGAGLGGGEDEWTLGGKPIPSVLPPRLASPGTTDPSLRVEEVDAATFHKAFQPALNSKRGAYLSPYTEEEFAKMTLFLSADGMYGGAVKTADDGVKEAVSLFNVGGAKTSGGGIVALEQAVAAGATRLDCLGKGLKKKYEKVGFVVTETIEWDDKYAPDGWDYEKEGRPSVYVMELVK